MLPNHDAAPARHGIARLGFSSRPRLALAALLVAAAAILVTEAIGDSVTVDEFGHLPSGVYYLETGHFDVYNLSPPLLRELAALPVLAARPAGDFARFTTSPTQLGPGYEFMERNRDRYHLLFVLGRLPMVALALMVAVYLCGVRHLGTRPGLAAAALAVFIGGVCGTSRIIVHSGPNKGMGVCTTLMDNTRLFEQGNYARNPIDNSQVGVRYHAIAPFGLEFTLNYLYQRWGGDDGTNYAPLRGLARNPANDTRTVKLEQQGIFPAEFIAPYIHTIGTSGNLLGRRLSRRPCSATRRSTTSASPSSTWPRRPRSTTPPSRACGGRTCGRA